MPSAMMPAVLAAWLAPAGWLAVSSLMLADGREGLWAGLLLALAPLAALSIRSEGRHDRDGTAPAFTGAVSIAVSGVLLWANLALAGDIAGVLGRPRWEGVAMAAGASLLAVGWPRAGRAGALAVALSVFGLVLPLVTVLLVSGRDPLDAWGTAASREAVRFEASSEAVREGRVLGPLRAPIVFEEEHRITAPEGGIIRILLRDGDRVGERPLELGPGQSLTLRPGDALVADGAVRLRFEARRRVPGAPPSGVAWADGQRGSWAGRLGLAVTLLGGAVGLLSGVGGQQTPRSAVGVVGGGLLTAFLWAQGWAVYSLLLAPELLLGGVTPARLVEVPMLVLGRNPAARVTQVALIVAILVGVAAAAQAWLDVGSQGRRRDDGRPSRELAVRAPLIVAAGLASLWPVEPWPLMLLALGAAAAALAPAALSAEAPGRAEIVAGALGLLVFVAVGLAGWLYPGRGEILAAAGRFPALAAVPAALMALPLARRVTG